MITLRESIEMKLEKLTTLLKEDIRKFSCSMEYKRICRFVMSSIFYIAIVSAYKKVVKLTAKGIFLHDRNQHLNEVNRNDYTKAHPTYTELSTSHFLSCLIVSKL